MAKLPFMKFFPMDFDRDMAPHPLEIRGAWISIIDHLWVLEPRGRAIHSVQQWGRILGVDDETTMRIINYIKHEKIGDCNAASNDHVTIISRRMEREEKDRENTRLRVQKYRDHKDCNADVTPPCNGNVTPQKLEVRSQKLEKDKYTYSESFLSFYEVYPRKIGKKLAFLKWKALEKSKRLPILSTLIEAVVKQKESDQWTRDDGKYIPHLATWLNQERWNDELDPKREDRWI